MEQLKEQRQIIKSFPKDCLFSTNVAMENFVYFFEKKPYEKSWGFFFLLNFYMKWNYK